MRIAVYLNNLDESYQTAFFLAAREKAIELGIDILCIQKNHLTEENCRGAAPGYIAVDGAVILTSSLINKSSTEDTLNFMKSFGSVISAGLRIPEIPSIVIKAVSSMEYLMKHLLYDHNYRSFLYIGGPAEHQDNITRENIFRHEIEKAAEQNPSVCMDIRYANFTEYSGMMTATDYIASHRGTPPDVIVCANDSTAIGVIKTLHAQRDPCWRKCAVTGFDDLETAQTTMASLTTVRQPLDDMGRMAVETLCRKLSGKPIPDITLIDSYPVIRNSCGCTDTSWQHSIHTCGEKDSDDMENFIAKIQYEQAKTSLAQQHVSFFGRSINTATTIEEILTELRNFLGNTGIRTFYLVLSTENEHHSSSRGLLMYEKAGGKELSFIPPKPVILKSFFDSVVFSHKNTPAGRVIHYLTAGAERLGMIIYDAENTVHPQLCSCSIFLANAIKRIRTLDEEKKRSLELEKKVAERTANLLAANRKLKKESKQRIKVEAEVLKISELERQRFSMDLHDDICQRLGGISMMCRGMSAYNDRLKELSDMLEETLRRTRQYAHNSFPVELDSLGIQKAVETLCRTTERQNGGALKIPFTCEGNIQLSESDALNIYRIIQEAVRNAVKYAQADKIQVSIIQEGNTLSVAVRDNGRGNSSVTAGEKGITTDSTGIGIRSIRYRADQMGAELKISSSEKKGTSILLTIQRSPAGPPSC